MHLAANPAHTPSQANAAVLAAATPNLVGDARTTPNLLLHTGSAPVVPPGAGCPAATNGTDVPIPDRGAATSPITITGCTSTPTDAAKITVDIVHTWRGDLVLDLIAPDGSPYRLKSANVDDSADNVKTTYTLNLAAESPNGTWTLRAQDLYGGDWGHINAWTLDL
ncbi:proprotein convertase P-domain-containing protein [Actinokineospora soli]|uniref:Proprotein convertase P-domain-containing protein n=1 Tax=Actinokineospora soli TaxID=1048753 RepID=A0ABW2TSW7_9PSEU